MTKTRYFSGLDVVRTMLALSVAAGHFLYWSHTPTDYPASFFLAVDFFFVLSGFVLTQSTLNDRSANSSEFAKSFVVRRCFRLCPLYLALFIPSAVAAAATFGTDKIANYLTSLLLLQGVGAVGRVTPVLADSTIGIAWSISVELWIGVLLFPVVFTLRKSPRRIVLLCALTILGCLAAMAFSPHHFDVTVQRFAKSISFGAVRGLLGFSIGAICYLAYSKFGNSAPRSATSLMEIALIGAFLILFVPNSRNVNFDFAAPFLIATLLFTLASERGLIGAALCSVKFAWIRPLSYSIYLVHPLVIFGWKYFAFPFSNGSTLPFLAIVLTLSVPLYWFVELPGIKLGKARRIKRTLPSDGALHRSLS